MEHDQRINLTHGSGGKSTRRLIESIILPAFRNPSLEVLSDAAMVEQPEGKLALTTDSFVVHPIIFPGGSIGKLAVNGTVNDLSVSGAKPLAILSSWIIEEGLPLDVFKREIAAMAEAASLVPVPVIGGDIKVVEKGKADSLFITTTGIGSIALDVNLGVQRVRPSDKIILSGPIGDHGITILMARGELELEADLKSDSRPLWSLIDPVLKKAPTAVKWMRDPTRGGVATALNELAKDCGLAIAIREEQVPMRDEVRGASEILGIDPLYIACEGQFLAVVEAKRSREVVEILRSTPGGEGAVEIGEIREYPPATVLGFTKYGGSRIIDMLVGEPLPRIC